MVPAAFNHSWNARQQRVLSTHTGAPREPDNVCVFTPAPGVGWPASGSSTGYTGGPGTEVSTSPRGAPQG